MAIAPRTMARPATRAGTGAPILASIATGVPAHRVDQAGAKALIGELFGDSLGAGRARLLEIFDHSGIEQRHVCMPLDWYARPHSWAESNARYLEHGLALAEDVSGRALAAAGLEPRDVDHIVFVSSTGIAAPSLDARLANRLGFRSDVRRTPVWGLGCAGGAAGLSRARDFARADERGVVLLVTLELCSLTFQRGDLDRRNLVATSLFADGAAAAVVVGASGPGCAHGAPPVPIELLASHSTLWPDTLDVMGWDVDGDGLHVVFSRDIPTLVRRWLRADLEGFLATQGMALADVDHLFCHPGGPKVLAALAEALGRPPHALHHSRDVLREHGNMSSPTCLFVLERALRAGGLRAGELGIVAALGPGFASEFVLVRIGGAPEGHT